MAGTVSTVGAQRLESVRKLLGLAHAYSARGYRYGGTEGHPTRRGIACLSEENRLGLKGAVLKALALAYARAEGFGEGQLNELDDFAPVDAADGWAGLHDCLTEGLACIAATRGKKG